jgi:hypothetical protein
VAVYGPTMSLWFIKVILKYSVVVTAGVGLEGMLSTKYVFSWKEVEAIMITGFCVFTCAHYFNFGRF